MLAAPLMVSDDLRRIGRAGLQALENAEVLAVDQDPAGVQARLVSATGQGEVWVKPLAGGARAVALLNRGSGTLVIHTSAAGVGLAGAGRHQVRNLWSNATFATNGPISARVAPYSTVMLRVSG
jgi:alpha-galactosidase